MPVDMHAVTVRRIGEFEYGRRQVAKPGAGEVLIEVTVTGLCRTDLKIIRVGHRDLVLPCIPGEEVVGTIVETGSGVAGFTAGQRVYVYPGQWCGQCQFCLAGAENLCRSMSIMGFHRDGGFAEYVVVPAQSLIAVPEGLSDEEAVFAEPLSCCLNGLELARLKEGERIGIWGGGPAGTLLARASAARGALPTIIENDPMRAAMAGPFAGSADHSFDVCVVAVGSNDAYSQALACLGPRGRMVVFSGLGKDTSVMPVDYNQLHYLEQTIVGAYGCCYRHGVQALELLAGGQVRVDDMISHRMPLSRLDEALDLVERRQCMKIHLYPKE